MDEENLEQHEEAAKNNSDWRGRLRFIILVGLVCLALGVAAQMFVNLNHHPQLIIPPEARLALDPTNHPQLSKKFVEELLRAMPTCVVGQKYGAVCQDGTVTYDHSDDPCSEHGGVKTWIECR